MRRASPLRALFEPWLLIARDQNRLRRYNNRILFGVAAQSIPVCETIHTADVTCIAVSTAVVKHRVRAMHPSTRVTRPSRRRFLGTACRATAAAAASLRLLPLIGVAERGLPLGIAFGTASVLAASRPPLALAAGSGVAASAAYVVFTWDLNAGSVQGETTGSATLSNVISLNQLSVGNTTSTGGKLNALQIQKVIDQSSAMLLHMSVSGSVIPRTDVLVKYEDGTVSAYRFSNLIVEQLNVKSGNDTPGEQIRFYKQSVDPTQIGSTSWTAIL